MTEINFSYFIASLFCMLGVIATAVIPTYFYAKVLLKSKFVENHQIILMYAIIFYMAVAYVYYRVVDDNLVFAYKVI